MTKDPGEPKSGESANQEREVSPEIVEAIEKSSFGMANKVDILLTASGIKPASWIHLTVEGETRPGVKVELSDVEIEGCRDLLKKIGNYKEGRHFINPTKWENGSEGIEKEFEFMLGSTPKNLEKLCSTVADDNEHEIGIALGYSETAVDAYCGESEMLDISKFGDEVLFSEAFVFNPGKLSADHWQEELQHYQRWADYVRRVSPNLYNQIMGISYKTGE